MQDADTLDGTDQELVHALQVAPRASWTDIGAALGTDPVTASRRWQRLTSNGQAWISCYPGRAMATVGQGCLAFVEVDCASGQVAQVARQLAEQPGVSTVEHVTGGRDLLLTVMAGDLNALSHWVTFVLGAVCGVTASRTHLAGVIHVEGSRWRLRCLSEQQIRQLTGRRTAPGSRPPFELSALDRRIAVALSTDGRAPSTALAEHCGAHPDTVRRRANRLFAAGMMQARCELARPLSEWPVAVILWARVPPHELAAAARLITGMREVRLCAAVTGRNNLLVISWVRSVDDTQRFAAQLGERVPGLTIGDQAVTMWTVKLSGHLLNERGFRVGSVPVDPWVHVHGTAPVGS